jgi:hypothetical protein
MKDHEKQQQTALLAYQFWMERGCPVGSPTEDWFRAELQLEEFVVDAAEEAPADIAADPPDSAPGRKVAVAVSSR